MDLPFQESARRKWRFVFSAIQAASSMASFKTMSFAQMISELTPGDPSSPQFCYHVGDVVYFTGSHDDYYAQFQEPYALRPKEQASL
jgi:hypothetical protein